MKNRLLDDDARQCLTQLVEQMVDQQQARILIPAQQNQPGFWFGGGNLVRDGKGTLYLVGRYRNQGDSRTGLSAGERGLELAVFRSDDGGRTFQKLHAFSKADLSLPNQSVLSIEGSALRLGPDGVELFVSTEKDGLGYPDGLESYLKPGTGVWTIDVMTGGTVDSLDRAKLRTVLRSHDPQAWHVKDPFVYEGLDGRLFLFFCTHPFSWSSSNSAFTTRRGDQDFDVWDETFFPRGKTWDVAISRATAAVDVPRLGRFADRHVTLLFYDGGECLRDHDQHQHSVQRPRGYSCEELGGVACFLDGDPRRLERLSVNQPMFISPYGSGCSRYVDALWTGDEFLVTWQQSQPDRSQPLVLHRLPRRDVERILE